MTPNRAEEGRRPQLRMIEEADIPEVASLLSEHLRLPKLDARYLRWKYFANPCGPGVCLVAAYESRIVGVSGAMPYDCEAADRTFTVWFGTDSLVAPEFRRRGIFTALLALRSQHLVQRKAGISFSFVSNMSRGAFEKTGHYRFVTSIDYYFSLLRPEGARAEHARLFTHVRGVAARVLGNTSGRKSCLRAADKAEITALDFSGPNDGLETVAHLSTCHAAISIRKTQEFLLWRYGQHPWHEYRGWLVAINGKPSGYVILRDANIVDIGGADQGEVWSALLGVAIREAGRAGCEDLHTYNSGPLALSQALRRAGYIRWDYSWRPRDLYPPQIMVASRLGSTHTEMPDIYDPGSWLLQMADLDCGL